MGRRYNGHLETLKYLLEHGCPVNAGTCEGAAKQGHLETLRYAHEMQCPWDERTCAAAAEGGHLDCLQYAHEKGCPWDGRTYHNAECRNGRKHILAYLDAKNCPKHYDFPNSDDSDY